MVKKTLTVGEGVNITEYCFVDIIVQYNLHVQVTRWHVLFHRRKEVINLNKIMRNLRVLIIKMDVCMSGIP